VENATRISSVSMENVHVIWRTTSEMSVGASNTMEGAVQS